MTSRILLVEDEPGVVRIVSDLLRAAGYAVDSALDGNSGLRRASEEQFDLLILDVMLPGLDGRGLCRNIRERGFDGAILMLTARGEPPERVLGLRSGADDYLSKPFDASELVARVEALLRRVHKQELTPVMRFRFGQTTADFLEGKVYQNGKPVSLAPKEIELLRLLINHRGRVLTRDQILKQVWPGQPFITERTVDVHIAWLRQKLETTPNAPRHIQTIRGEGYRFTTS